MMVNGDPEGEKPKKSILTPDDLNKFKGKIGSYSNPNEKLQHDDTPMFHADEHFTGRTLNADKFKDYIQPYEMFDADLEKIRASRQSTSEQIWNRSKTFIPNVILGLTESIGYLGEGVNYLAQASIGNLKASEMDFSNKLVEFSKAGKDALREGNPVYRENNDVLGVNDMAWWVQNGFDLTESIAQFIALGSGVARGTKIGLEALNLGTLGKFGRAVETIALNYTPAVALAYTEGAMSGSEVFNKSYQAGMEQLDKKYKDADGNITDKEAYRVGQERVKSEAGLAAAKTVSINTIVNTGLNISSVSPFTKGFQRTRGALESLNAAEKASWKNSIMEAFGVEAPQESLEELINVFAENAGLNQAMSNFGLEDRKSLSKLFGEALTSDEGILSMILGAVGGIGQTLGTTAIGQTKLGKSFGLESFKVENEKRQQLINSVLNDNDELSNTFINYLAMRNNTDKITNAVINNNEKAYNDLMDQRLLNYFMNAYSNGTTEYMEEHINGMIKDSNNDEAKKNLEKLKEDLLTTENLYMHAKAKFGATPTVIPEYIKDRLKLNRQKSEIADLKRNLEASIGVYRMDLNNRVDIFAKDNGMPNDGAAIIDHVVDLAKGGNPENFGEILRNNTNDDQRSRITEFVNRESTLTNTLGDFNYVKTNNEKLNEALSNHEKSLNNFSSNWGNNNAVKNKHESNIAKLKEAVRRAENKSNTKSGDPSKDVSYSPIKDELTNKNSESQNKDIDGVDDVATNIESDSNNKESTTAKPKVDTKSLNNEFDKKLLSRSNNSRKSNKTPVSVAESNAGTIINVEETTIKPTAQSFIDHAVEVKNNVVDINNVKPPTGHNNANLVNDKGESHKKKRDALSIGKRNLNVFIKDGYTETRFDESGKPSLNQDNIEVIEFTETPFNGPVDLRFEVDENYSRSENGLEVDSFSSRKYDPDKLPIKIITEINGKNKVIGYVHDTERLPDLIYDDDDGNLEKQTRLLKSFREEIFKAYNKTGISTRSIFVSKTTNAIKSHGTLITTAPDVYLPLTEAFNGEKIKIGVVKDSSGNVYTAEGIHKMFPTPWSLNVGSIVAILPSAKTKVEGNSGGVGAYLKVHNVDGIKNQKLSEDIKSLFSDILLKTIISDSEFEKKFFEAYEEPIKNAIRSDVEVHNKLYLKTVKVISELFFSVQDEFNSELGKNTFYFDLKGSKLWLDPIEGLDISGLAKLYSKSQRAENVRFIESTIKAYVNKHLGSKYFNVNPSLLGKTFTSPNYTDGKFNVAVNSDNKNVRSDYQTYLDDNGILEAGFTGLRTSKDNVIFFADSVIEYGIPQLEDAYKDSVIETDIDFPFMKDSNIEEYFMDDETDNVATEESKTESIEIPVDVVINNNTGEINFLGIQEGDADISELFHFDPNQLVAEDSDFDNFLIEDDIEEEKSVINVDEDDSTEQNSKDNTTSLEKEKKANDNEEYDIKRITDEKEKYFLNIGYKDGNPVYLNKVDQDKLIDGFTNSFINALFKHGSRLKAFETVQNNIKKAYESLVRTNKPLAEFYLQLDKVFDVKDKASIKQLIINELPSKGLRLGKNNVVSKSSSEASDIKTDQYEVEEEEDDQYILDELNIANELKFGDDKNFTKDLFTTASGRIRRMLGFLKIPIISKNANGELDRVNIRYQVNKFGMNDYIPSRQIYNELLQYLHKSINLEEMKSILYDLSKEGRPEMFSVLLSLDNADIDTQNEFYTLFSSQFNEFYELTRSVKGDDTTFKNQFKNRNQATYEITTKWNSNAKRLLYNTVNQESKINLEKLIKIENRFKEFRKRILPGWNKEYFNANKEEFKEILNSIGLEVNDDYLNNYFNYFSTAKIRKKAINPETNFLYPSFNSSLDIVSNIISDLRKGEAEQPFKQASNRLNDLALIELRSGKYDVNHSFRMNKKGYYGFNRPFVLSRRINKLKEDEYFVASLLNTAYSSTSTWLKNLFVGNSSPTASNQTFINNFRAIIFNGVRKVQRKATTNDIKSISPREREIANVNSLLGGIRLNKRNEIIGTGLFISNTFSDKTTVPAIPVPVYVSDKLNLSGNILEYIYESGVKSELNRMQLVNEHVNGSNSLPDKELTAGVHYAKSYRDNLGMGFYFLNFDFLNHIPDIFNNRLKSDVTDTNDFKVKVLNNLKLHFDSLVDLKIEDWLKNGLVKKVKNSEGNVVVLSNGEESIALSRHFDSRVRSNLKVLMRLRGIDVNSNNLVKFAALNYEANHLLNSFNLRQITFDPATAGKPKIVNGELDVDSSIKATWDNVKKRNAMLIAPGAMANWNDPTYLQIIIDDAVADLSITNPTEFEYIKSVDPEIAELFKKIDITDAQELTTVREHLNVLLSYGKITKDEHDKALSILSKENPSYEEIASLSSSVVLEPLKPVHTSFEERNGLSFPTYIKSSSFPLIPFITRGTQLDKVRIAAERLEKEKNKPVRIVPPSGAKLGVRGKPVSIYNNGKIADNLDFSNSYIELNRDGFALQQDPTPVKSKVNRGTQESILIFQDWKEKDENGNEYKFKVNITKDNNKELTAKELFTTYNDAQKRLIKLSFDSLINKLGAVSEDAVFEGEVINRIKDLNKLSTILQEEVKGRGLGINAISALTTNAANIVDDLRNKRNDKINDLDERYLTPEERTTNEYREERKSINNTFKALYDDALKNVDFLIPLVLHPQFKRLEPVILSLITNNVIRLKMPGTSGVLGSEIGLTQDDYTIKDKIVGSGVHWINGIPKTELAYDEIILPFWFGRTHKEKVKNFELYKTGKLVVNDLEEIYGFRIPTQALNSIGSFKVVGYMHPIVGSLTIASKRLTKTMGSDFDHDKLTIYHHNYAIDEKTGSISKVEYGTDDINNLDKKQLQNYLIDLRLAVINHESKKAAQFSPNGFGKFTSIAADFIAMNTKNSTIGISALSSINDRNSFFDGQGGKNGVAKFSLISVGFTKSQLSNLYIKVPDSGIMFKDSNGDIYEDDNDNTDLYEFLDDHGNEIKPTGAWKLDKIDGFNDNKISKVIEYLQSGAVDNAKELILNVLNLNDETFSVAGLIAQAGFDEDFIAYFLKQPIIEDYVERVRNGSDSFSDSYGVYKDDIVSTLYQEYSGKEYTPDKSVAFSLDELKEMVTNKSYHSNTGSFNKMQAEVINAFNNYRKIADDLNKVISQVRQEAKGAGKNFVNNARIISNYENIEATNYIGNVVNLKNLFYDEFQKAIDQTKNLFGKTVDGLPIVHLYEQGFVTARDTIFKLLDKTANDEKLTQEVYDSYLSYLFTGLPGITNNSEKDRIDLIRGEGNIVSQYNLLPDYIKDNLFLKQLHFYTNESGRNLVKFDNTKTRENIDDLHIAFIELLTHPDNQIKLFAENLVKYSFLTGGNAFNPLGFHKYIPAVYLISKNIGNQFKSIDLNQVSAGWVDQFFQNNPDRAIRFEIDKKVWKEYSKGKTVRLQFDTKNNIKVNKYSRPYVDEEGNTRINPYTYISSYDFEEKSFNLYKLSNPDVAEYTKIPNYSDLPIELGEIYDYLKPPIVFEPIEKISNPSEVISGKEKVKDDVRIESLYSINDQSAPMIIEQLKRDITKPAQLIILDLIATNEDVISDLKFSTKPSDIKGVFARYNNHTIEVHPEQFDSLNDDEVKSKLQDVLIEEMIHAITTTRMYTFGDNALIESLRNREEIIINAIKNRVNLKLSKSLDELKKLDPNLNSTTFLDAYNYYLSNHLDGRDTYVFTPEVKNKIFNILSKESKLAYPMFNNHEFVAHTLINDTFQEFLRNEKWSQEKSFFDKVAEFVIDVLKAVIGDKYKNAFGEVENTLLKEALTISFARISSYDIKHKELIKPDTNKDNSVIEKATTQVVKNDKSYELFPGIYSNSEQTEALDKLKAFAKSKEEVFVLVGRGGTGKTTILKKAIEETPEFGRVIGGTLSHAAKKILGNSIGKENAFTMASLLAIKLNESTGEFVPDEFARKKGQLKIRNGDTIIIDETSMITSKMKDEILKLKKPGAKVIFVGDNVQLPPIGDNVTESSTFRAYKTDKEFSKLKLRMRQGEESPIVGITDLIANNIEKPRTEMILAAISDENRVTKYDAENDSGVVFTANEEATIKGFVRDYLKYYSDINSTKMVTFNNELHNSPQSVKNLNLKVRAELYKDSPFLLQNQFNSGELLTAYDTFVAEAAEAYKYLGYHVYSDAPIPIFYNSENFRVTSVGPVYTRKGVAVSGFKDPITREWAFPTVDVTLLTEDGNTITVPVVAQEGKEQYNKIISQLLSDSNSKMKSLAYRITEKFANINYGYAITSHKAQGSTYRNVYVFEDNILGATNASGVKAKNQSLYVATSRPSAKLIMHGARNAKNPAKFNASFEFESTVKLDKTAKQRMLSRIRKPIC